LTSSAIISIRSTIPPPRPSSQMARQSICCRKQRAIWAGRSR
jgi:hypothetical protein